MSRRSRTLVIAWTSTVLLALVMLVLPVPYVALTPTTPVNTLGPDPSTPGTPVLRVHGPSFPTSGQLQLTTVGIRDRLKLGEALWRWGQGQYAVVPRTVIYPDDLPQRRVDQQNQQEMTDSRSAALVAALGEIAYPDTVIGDFPPGSKAVGLLSIGDRIVAIDGHPITRLDQVRVLVSPRRPGEVMTVTVARGGQTVSKRITLISSAEADKAQGVTAAPRTLLGVAPVSVDITLADVSGPSAGLMFALGIIDKLTPGDLTGGRIVAGTGTIDDKGTVGPIGGIQQKLFGAAAAHASYFLVPHANCSEARSAHVKGMALVDIPEKAGLHTAYLDVQAIGHGNPPSSLC